MFSLIFSTGGMISHIVWTGGYWLVILFTRRAHDTETWRVCYCGWHFYYVLGISNKDIFRI